MTVAMLTPYVDVTLWPTFDISEVPVCDHFTLGFIVADQNNNPSWGGYYGMETKFYKDIVTKLRNKGGAVICSFGGASGVEIATGCKTAEEAYRKYKKVIDTYNLKSIDFDIEGGAVGDTRSNSVRAHAILMLQNAYPDLVVSLTLPVMPTGLNADCLAIVQETPCDIVNLMCMDYGNVKDMGAAAISAAKAVRKQTGKNIGITPMIGVNDTGEVFTLADAKVVAAFCEETCWIKRKSFWSIIRDSGVQGDLDKSSQIMQQPWEFCKILK